MSTRTRILRPVADPGDSHNVLDLSWPDLEQLDGHRGHLTLLCPSCRRSLAINTLEGQLGHVVLRCACGAYSATT